jgi:predicted lysophospholipase L1 biosynthesis ABC-type transport system permease subunit
VLAGLLALLALGTTAHGLLTATRRRRRDLGLLKAVGFTRRQVTSAVAWQATTVAVVALLVGLPLGVATGRWLWSLLADRLGIPSEPVTPTLAVLLAVPATLVLLNLVAAVPGRHAGAVPAATVLRSE